MFSFSPSHGKVCLNQQMPEDIRNRLSKDPAFLEVLRTYQDTDFGPVGHRYWCFPQFKYSNPLSSFINHSKLHNDTIQTTSERSHQSSPRELERSLTPNKGNEINIETETIEDYLRFPDPQKYMIGFICGTHEPQPSVEQTAIVHVLANKRIKDGASNK